MKTKGVGGKNEKGEKGKGEKRLKNASLRVKNQARRGKNIVLQVGGGGK